MVEGNVMTNIWIVSFAGGVGAAAFGLLYHVKPKHLPYAMIGGFITTLIMMAGTETYELGNLISNFAASFFGALFCIFLSRHKKAPFTVFMIPSLFPLVPGRALYYSMVGFMEHNKELFINNIVSAVEIAFGIAIGIMLANIFNGFYLKGRKKVENRIKG